MMTGLNQASQQLAAVADGLAGRSIQVRLTRVGDTPVLTVEDSAPGQDPATVSADPDTTRPVLPLECTCIWTAAPGTTPAAIADSIMAVLNAVRPFTAAGQPATQHT